MVIGSLPSPEGLIFTHNFGWTRAPRWQSKTGRLLKEPSHDLNPERSKELAAKGSGFFFSIETPRGGPFLSRLLKWSLSQGRGKKHKQFG
jgi:hypothetical protein